MRSQWYAQVSNGIVIGTLLVNRDDSDPDWAHIAPDLIPTDAEVPLDSTYANGVFTPPLPVTPPRVLSKFAFIRLLTPTEYVSMFTQADPMLIYGVACFNAAADQFNIDDPMVTQMLDYCVAVGALTQTRKDELWTAMQAAAM